MRGSTIKTVLWLTNIVLLGAFDDWPHLKITEVLALERKPRASSRFLILRSFK
jgi:hypothetical protein